MTHREPPPTLHCPACGGTDVQASTKPNLGRHECHGCFTWFNGGADEWHRGQYHRENRVKRRGDHA